MLVIPERRECLPSQVQTRLAGRCCVQTIVHEGQWLATLRDISIHGVGLVADQPFRPGMLLSLRLPTALHFVRVLHVRHQRGRSWVLGGQFDRPLPKKEFDALRTREPSLVPTSERRTVVRHATRLNAACPVAHAIEEGPWWTTIRGVSITGISLLAERPFKPGALLSVQLPGPAKATLLRVSHARRQAESKCWVADCAFLTRLPAAQVLRAIPK
jgi:hypothetical protein